MDSAVHDSVLATVLDSLAALGPSAVMVVCIDGPAGAGKTTLAQKLNAAISDSAVVHMDDLYGGWAEGLGQPLFERVLAQVVNPHLNGERIAFTAWDWHNNKWGPTKTVPTARVLILEGVGACSAPLRPQAALTIFLDASSEVAMHRAIARDGEQLRSELSRWVIAQDEFYVRDATRAQCDVVIAIDYSENEISG